MLSAVLLVPGALSLYELVAPCLFGARPGLGGDNAAGGGQGKGSATEGEIMQAGGPRRSGPPSGCSHGLLGVGALQRGSGIVP